MADVEWVKYIIMTIKNDLRKTCFQNINRIYDIYRYTGFKTVMYAKEKKLESAVSAVNLKIFTNIFAAYFDRKELYYLLNQALNL